jgi:tetratricopeptide (TPR) repeat protein
LIVLALPGPAFAHPELEAQIGHLTTELAHRPEDAELLLQRADLHRRHGDLASARADIDAAAGFSPPPELDFYRGRPLLDSGDFQAATEAFGRYLGERPRHVKTHVLRADAYNQLGRFLEASGDLALALEYSEHPSPSLFYLQSAALVRAGELHWPAARRAAEQGLDRFPGEVSLLGVATDIALAMDDHATANAYLDRLPPALRDLPRWQWRSQLSVELGSGDASRRAALRERARRSLLEGLGPA